MSTRSMPTDAVIDVLACTRCCADVRLQVINEELRCPNCSTVYPIGPHGSVLGHYPLEPEVVRELEGVRAEHPGVYPSVDAVVLQQVESVLTFEERKQSTAASAKDYYLSTEMNFRHAFDTLELSGNETVLEIGAEHGFPFLEPFLQAGCECFATNIFYVYAPDQRPPDRLHVVLGDMNKLPYRNDMFDVLLISATTHHSPNLSVLMRELSRVTKPGGTILLLNDPSRGLLKHAFRSVCKSHTSKGGSRDELIHENEYSPLAYRRLARANGLELISSFFSAYYDFKLRSGQTAGVRFATLAALVSRIWRFAPARKALCTIGLLPAQLLIGLEINMIFRKRSLPSSIGP